MTVDKVKAGDFIEIDFVGKVKLTDKVFDLTLKDVAKKEGVEHTRDEFKPSIVKVGAGHVLKGLDDVLVGKKIGDEFELELSADEAFGPRDSKKIQISSLSVFRKKKVNPIQGMQLDVDGSIATVRSVTGGRVILDFNHALAGKALHYWVRINKKITELDDKAKAIIEMMVGPGADAKVKESKLEIRFKEKIPPQLGSLLEAQIKKQLPELKKVTIF